MAVHNPFLPGGEELLTTVTRAVVGNVSFLDNMFSILEDDTSSF
jgi:hypothetical protein